MSQYNYIAPLPRDLWLLDPKWIFLNNGSFGACPKPVFEKYQWWQREMERQPVEFIGRRLPGLLADARAKLAAFLNTQAHCVVYVTNITVGANIAARSIPLKAGDEVLTTDQEYGAILNTFDYICGKAGATLKRQHIAMPVTTREAFVEQFWSGVTPRTRAVYLSHIAAPTALIFPVKEICRRARAAGILSFVDGAHAVGQLPLDMADIGADFYSSNLHKWCCAPRGSAFLYARPEVHHLVEPLTVSFGYDPKKPNERRLVEYLEYIGTRDCSSFLAVPTALEFLAEHNWEKVRLQCHELARQFRERMANLTGLAPLSPDSTDWFMQMAAAPLPPCNYGRVGERLRNDYHIEIPVGANIRLSAQAFVTQGDVDILLGALEKILPEEKTTQ
jgi:isopenicillin-N epimerase